MRLVSKAICPLLAFVRRSPSFLTIEFPSHWSYFHKDDSFVHNTGSWSSICWELDSLIFGLSILMLVGFLSCWGDEQNEWCIKWFWYESVFSNQLFLFHKSQPVSHQTSSCFFWLRSLWIPSGMKTFLLVVEHSRHFGLKPLGRVGTPACITTYI